MEFLNATLVDLALSLDFVRIWETRLSRIYIFPLAFVLFVCMSRAVFPESNIFVNLKLLTLLHVLSDFVAQ